jgi:hypothetical protein
MFSDLVILMRDTAVSDIFLNLPAGCNNETEDPVPSGDIHHAERAVGGVGAHQEQQWAADEQLVIPQQ